MKYTLTINNVEMTLICTPEGLEQVVNMCMENDAMICVDSDREIVVVNSMKADD